MAAIVEADAVRERLRDGRTLLVNVLPEAQFAHKRIPGSVNAPVEAPGFEERIRSLAPSKDQPLIVHCSGPTCAASTKAARRLEAMGYTDVLEFKAGLEGWAQAGHDFESGGAGEEGGRRPERPQRGERPVRSSAGLPVAESNKP